MNTEIIEDIQNENEQTNEQGPKSKRLIVVIGVILLIIVIIATLVFKDNSDKVRFQVLAEQEIPQDIVSTIIPEYRQLERALSCVVNDKIYVLACRGEKPTSGYELNIDKIILSDKDGTSTLTVYVSFKDPSPGAALTQALTYPCLLYTSRCV